MKKNNFTEKVFITNSSKATKRLGRDFAKVLEKGDIVCLYGDLGSGKTTFVQGLAEGLGIKQRIISPTFIIVRNYKIRINDPHFAKASRGEEGLMINDFYHIDLYRINNNDIEGLGIEEIINDKNNIVTIEWAEKLKSWMPAKRIDIKFYYEKESGRKVTFSLTT